MELPPPSPAERGQRQTGEVPGTGPGPSAHGGRYGSLRSRTYCAGEGRAASFSFQKQPCSCLAPSLKFSRKEVSGLGTGLGQGGDMGLQPRAACQGPAGPGEGPGRTALSRGCIPLAQQAPSWPLAPLSSLRKPPVFPRSQESLNLTGARPPAFCLF